MISFFNTLGTWREVVGAARTTISRDRGKREPSNKWKKKILLAEHSPIRQLMFKWKWEWLMSWVSVHFVRHKYGIEHWVSTQRTDRTGEDRDKKSQNSPVSHECMANAQAMINISRKRLCNCASVETRKAWQEVIEEVKKVDSVLASVCVPDCIYRGFCPEYKKCGYSETEKYRKRLEEYRSVS